MRDRTAALADAGVQVVAVSPDGEDVTLRFCQEHGLKQTTLLDPDREIAKAYQVARVSGWLPNRRISYRIDSSHQIAGAVHGELSLGAHLELAE